MKEHEEDLIDLEEVPIEEGTEITMVGSKVTATFVEDDSIKIPIIFLPKLPDPGSFSIPCIVGKVRIERGVCDLGVSVSIMPYSLFHRLHRGPLLAAPFSLRFANSSMTQPIGKLEDVPINICDIWLLEDFIVVDMPETDNAQIIQGRPILATASYGIDVREGRISFELEGRFVVFTHRKEDTISPRSSIMDALPLSSDCDIEDVLHAEDPPDSE